jgi:hypothetical protein
LHHDAARERDRRLHNDRRGRDRRLLHWAYRDELPKRGTSSAEGIWDHIEEFGQNGGIDPGHGAAQRYPHFGLPHPDAYEVERAVSALPDGAIDWASESEAILGDMLAIADTRPLTARPSAPRRATEIGYNTRHIEKRGRWRREDVAPARDIIMVRTFRTSALVTMHAGMGDRPDWIEDRPKPYRSQPERGYGVKIVGECRGKNHYSTGSYCPLQWLPSPITIADARADYLAWWRGLAASRANAGARCSRRPAAGGAEYPWLEPASLAVTLWSTTAAHRACRSSRSAIGPAAAIGAASVIRLVTMNRRDA